MAAFRKPTILRERVRWAYFKQNTELHIFLVLVVADAVYRMVGGDISKGISALCGVGLFCFLLAPIASMIADLFFALMEKLTRKTSSKHLPQSKRDDPSKDDPPPGSNPRSKRNRHSKNKRKSKGNPPSQDKATALSNRPPGGSSSAKGTRLSKSNVGTAPPSPPGGKAQKNYLAKFVPEIRLQIFKHYFASFRPERYYRESHYRNIDSSNLLTALKDGRLNQRLYEEALEEYRKSYQLGLLLNGEGVGKGFIDTLKSGPFESLKDVTFGPGIIECIIHPDPVIFSSWNTSCPPTDVAERVSRWYLLQTVGLLGLNSRLSRSAKGLENITIFIKKHGMIAVELMNNFLTTSSTTFPNLKKICYCFSGTQINRERLELFMFLLLFKRNSVHPVHFKHYPWSSLSYGCQHEVSGFSRTTEGGRKIDVEFVIYH